MMVYFMLVMIGSSQGSRGEVTLVETIRLINQKKLHTIINLILIRILCVYLRIRKRKKYKKSIWLLLLKNNYSCLIWNMIILVTKEWKRIWLHKLDPKGHILNQISRQLNQVSVFNQIHQWKILMAAIFYSMMLT